MDSPDFNGLYLLGGMFALSLTFLAPTIKRDIKFIKQARKIGNDKLEGRVVEETTEEYCANNGKNLEDYSQVKFTLMNKGCIVDGGKYINFPEDYHAIASFEYHRATIICPSPIISGVALIPKHSG